MTKDEEAAILALLEGEYESPREAAQAVFDGVAALLMNRDAYGVGYHDEAVSLAWGPFYSIHAANKIAKVIGGGVAKLYAPTPLALKSLSKPASSRYCEECEHPRFAHNDRQWRHYQEQVVHPPGCVVRNCGCTQVYPYKKGR